MPHDPAKLVNDVLDAAEFILRHTDGRTLEDYCADHVLCAAVERQFITIGEAIRRLASLDPQVAAAIGEYPQIIAFRNIIVHGYDSIEDAIVWGIIQNEVPQLRTRATEVLRQAEETD
jgi:uncharacterized protein with HEPN domain